MIKYHSREFRILDCPLDDPKCAEFLWGKTRSRETSILPVAVRIVIVTAISTIIYSTAIADPFSDSRAFANSNQRSGIMIPKPLLYMAGDEQYRL